MIEPRIRELAKLVVEFWTPERRTQGSYAREADGEICAIISSDAVTFCAVGAMVKCCAPGTELDVYPLMQEVSQLGTFHSILALNDSSPEGPALVYQRLKRIAEGETHGHTEGRSAVSADSGESSTGETVRE